MKITIKKIILAERAGMKNTRHRLRYQFGNSISAVFRVEAIPVNGGNKIASGKVAAMTPRGLRPRGQRVTGNYKSGNPRAGFSPCSDHPRSESTIFVLDVADRVDL